MTTPAVEPSRGSLTTSPGTDIVSARNLLQGSPLSAEEAAARKIDGPPGFFLATEVDDAVFFALRRAPGGVVVFRLSPRAVEILQAVGAIRRRIPPGKTIQFLGDEVVIPPEAFGVFNALRETGEITVAPALWELHMQALADAIDYVRQRPERFFRAGSPEPVELITHIVSEVLLVGGSETCTMRSGDWWIISSNVDWLATCPDYAPEELFFRIVAFPEAGPNSMRAEILLTAFAQQVVTVSADHQSTIKGDVSQADNIWRLMTSRPDWKRTIAFRFAPACA